MRTGFQIRGYCTDQSKVVFRGACLFLLVIFPSVVRAQRTAHSEWKRSAIRFNRDIRPILNEHCFACHGPDRGKRMADLRFDARESALAHHAIVPGKPEKSLLVERIYARHNSSQMPPAAFHRPLNSSEKRMLARWISEGAVYEKHWAFVPLPAHTPVPSVMNPHWCRSPIDHFVLARLEREGLRPSPEAGRLTWLRRVTLDLTGLPPTLMEADAFVADRSPNAYRLVVDRLLASANYGERMATPWLDVARYADSYGYQSDQLCPTWPYRDWVVKAFNTNLSYDRFVTWQLAGDLLPNATREQRLATAFNRLHRMTNEGGSVPEEWRIEGLADRVRTLGSAFLGLTVECARCHDHKYDPLSQRNYYAFTAFFNSIDEYGLYDRADIVPSPTLLLPTPDQEREYVAAKATVMQAEQSLVRLRADREAAFRQWLSLPHSPAMPDETCRFDFEPKDGSILRNRAPGSTLNGTRQDEAAFVPGHNGTAIQFNGEGSLQLPELGRFTRHTPFTIAFWMRDPRRAIEPAVVFQACGGTDTGPQGYDLLIEQGRLSARIFRHWPGNGIGIRTRQAIPRDTWVHVAVTYDGSSRATGLQIVLNGVRSGVEVLRDRLIKGTDRHPLVFGQRFRDRGFIGGQIEAMEIFSRDLTSLELEQLSGVHRLTAALAAPAQHEGDLRTYYFSAWDPETRRANAAIAAARERLVAAEEAQFEIPVMEEMSAPRPAYVLARGRYDAPRSEANRVGRETPAAIYPYPSGLRRDRLGLAQWLTLPDHPLTARVAVNRFWALLFGKGLVETAEDFGTQGKPPTHPELLDWLARDFVRSGWDIKALLKQIVLSSAYRQTSANRPDLRERDPQNSLLARGPSHRLSAEAIRDSALAAARLLDDRRGGPPVSPYQPGDLWTESNSMSPAYHQSVGRDLYRRSLYTVWKRTAPMPNMMAFDTSGRELCVVRRQITNTPIQALVLLNDPQFVEAARAVGERTLKEAGSAEADRIRFAFRLLTLREPTPEEQVLLAALYKEQMTLFQSDPNSAARLIHIGDSKPDPALSSVSLAATTVLAQSVLNLDATLWSR